MDRAQRVHEENGVSLVMFTLKVRVIKMSKMSRFFVFSAKYSKKSVPVWAKYLSASERSYLGFSRKCHELLGSELASAKCQHLKKQNFGILLLIQHFLYFYPQYLRNG